jgi:hypothetical protein
MMSSPRWHRILICCDLVGVFSAALADAYDQVIRLASKDVMHRLREVLGRLEDKLGDARGELVEIGA